MGKRGPKPKGKTGYFCEAEEQAVLDYLDSDDAKEKNQIYITILKPAFEKMIECIIRRYKLVIPNEEYEDTFNDTLSNLLTKMDKFERGKGKKAYSYYGTICKNYLLQRIDDYGKDIMRYPSYDAMPENFGENISESHDRGARVAMETVKNLITRLDVMLSNTEKNDLKANEIKLGQALKNLFENWDYVLSTDGSNNLNKNAILLFLKESTGLTTPEIRNNMKKFKKEFLIIKDAVIN